MSAPFDPVALNRVVEGLATSHQRLLERLAGLTDEMVGRPSRLPSWSVGHVLAHLEGNARSLTQLFEAAEAGRVGVQYPGGAAARDAAIEAGSTRSAAEHLAAIRASIYELEGAMARAREAWYGSADLASGARVVVSELPTRRWREVEVHMADCGLVELGLDGPDAWSDHFVREDLRLMTMQWQARRSMGLTDLPPAVLRLDPRDRLAWLHGRATVEGVEPAGLMR